MAKLSKPRPQCKAKEDKPKGLVLKKCLHMARERFHKNHVEQTSEDTETESLQRFRKRDALKRFWGRVRGSSSKVQKASSGLDEIHEPPTSESKIAPIGLATPVRNTLFVSTFLEPVPEAPENEQEAFQRSSEFQKASTNRCSTAMNRVGSPDESHTLNEDLSLQAPKPSHTITYETPPRTLRRSRRQISPIFAHKLSPTSVNSEDTLVNSPVLEVSRPKQGFTPTKLQRDSEYRANSPENASSCGSMEDEPMVTEDFHDFVTRQRVAVAVEESDEVWTKVVKSLEEERDEGIAGLKKELRNSRQRAKAIEKKFSSLEKRAEEAEISVQSLKSKDEEALEAKDAEIASLNKRVQRSEQRARDAELSIESLTTKQSEISQSEDQEVAFLKEQLENGADQIAYLEAQIAVRVKDLAEVAQHWPAYKNRLAIFWMNYDEMLQHANETYMALSNHINQLEANVKADQDLWQQQAADLAAEQANSSELWDYIQHLESLVSSERSGRSQSAADTAHC